MGIFICDGIPSASVRCLSNIGGLPDVTHEHELQISLTGVSYSFPPRMTKVRALKKAFLKSFEIAKTAYPKVTGKKLKTKPKMIPLSALYLINVMSGVLSILFPTTCESSFQSYCFPLISECVDFPGSVSGRQKLT